MDARRQFPTCEDGMFWKRLDVDSKFELEESGVHCVRSAEEASVSATGKKQDQLKSGKGEWCTAWENDGKRYEEEEGIPDEEGTD